MNKWLAYVICTFFVCVAAVAIFFNPYHYSMYQGKYPVRDNWVTGKTEILKGSPTIKWNEISSNNVTSSEETEATGTYNGIRVGDVLKDGKVVQRSAP